MSLGFEPEKDPMISAIEEVSHIVLTNINFGTSVTRLGDLLDFVQVFKAFGNN